MLATRVRDAGDRRTNRHPISNNIPYRIHVNIRASKNIDSAGFSYKSKEIIKSYPIAFINKTNVCSNQIDTRVYL